MKSSCSLKPAEAEARWANQDERCGRGRVAAETAATSQLMKAFIHLHSHNIHARGRENKPSLKRKQSAPPQQERSDTSDGRLPVQQQNRCVCLYLCVCVCICVCVPVAAVGSG